MIRRLLRQASFLLFKPRLVPGVFFALSMGGGGSMEFQGYLLKINGREFPNTFIRAESYKSTPNQQTDQDDYTDGYGELHRNILPHTSTKIEFNLKPLDLAEKIVAQTYLIPRIELSVEYWNDEDNMYKVGRFSIPSIQYTIRHVDRIKKNIKYAETRVALIEY